MLYVLLGIVVIADLLAILFCHTEVQKKITYIFIFVDLIIMGLSYGQADISNYEKMYNIANEFPIIDVLSLNKNVIESYQLDMGYMFFNYVGTQLEVPFSLFRFILIAMFVLILYYTANKMCNFIGLFFLMYLIFPMYMDAIQIRNFMIEVILFYSFLLLVKQDKYYKVKYLLLLIIATTIHKLAIIYLPFAIFDSLKKYRISKILIYILVAFGLLMPLYMDYVLAQWMVIGQLISNADFESIARYSSYANVIYGKGYIYMWGFVVGVTLLLSYMASGIKRIVNNERAKWISTTRDFFLFVCCLMPAFPISSDLASRIVRNGLLMYIISIILYVEIEKRGIYRLTILLLGVLSLSMFGYYALYGNFGENVTAIMTENYLIDLLE